MKEPSELPKFTSNESAITAAKQDFHEMMKNYNNMKLLSKEASTNKESDNPADSLSVNTSSLNNVRYLKEEAK